MLLQPPALSHPRPRPRPPQKQQAAQQPLLVYVRPEDQYMHSLAAWSFTFAAENRAVAKDELQPRRLVMLVSAQAVQDAK
jgi:protein BCP1